MPNDKPSKGGGGGGGGGKSGGGGGGGGSKPGGGKSGQGKKQPVARVPVNRKPGAKQPGSNPLSSLLKALGAGLGTYAGSRTTPQNNTRAAGGGGNLPGVKNRRNVLGTGQGPTALRPGAATGVQFSRTQIALGVAGLAVSIFALTR